jgi:hypothetical protein
MVVRPEQAIPQLQTLYQNRLKLSRVSNTIRKLIKVWFSLYIKWFHMLIIEMSMYDEPINEYKMKSKKNR